MLTRTARSVGLGVLASLTCVLPALSQAPSPSQLVADASWNELHATDAAHPFRYREHDVDTGKSTLKEVVETRDGDVARLLQRGDTPLSADADADERSRLTRLRDDPGAMAKKRKKSQEENDRQNEMLRLLPAAFLYQLTGTVQGPSGPCYRLTFAPNPAFVPPDREAEVYHGMAGELWIDEAQKRIARIDAHLIADVNFGWGIAGRLYKGGTILVEQRDVGGSHWESTHTRLHLQGKILMIKSLVIDETDDATSFEPAPNDGYRAAIDYLLALPNGG